jgi:4-hydroxy-3-methylbut-2-enyl diphosphate reductase
LKVTVARPTGLCFGVRRAISELENALVNVGKIYGLGSPIHNPQEIERLERLGLVVVKDPADIPPGQPAFIRAHGVSPEVRASLLRRTDRIVDGTCPFVRNVQEKAALLRQEGYRLIIVGDASHPEVQGIMGYAGEGARVVGNAFEIPPDARNGKIGLVCQTTQKEALLEKVVRGLLPHAEELRVFNTICGATLERQQAVMDLAPRVDGMIVIGGKNSANTGKLVEISREAGVSTLWIEHYEELEGGWIREKENIGIAAGASTPDWLIRQLISTLESARSPRGMD